MENGEQTIGREGPNLRTRIGDGSRADAFGIDARIAASMQRRYQSRVLVMEEELLVRNLLRIVLVQMGCTVALAADGQETITLYAEAIRDGIPFDLVLLDLNVSFGLGGVETLEALRNLDSTVKAIVMSGYSGSDVIRNFTLHGFHGGLAKPFSLQLLRAVVTQALANRNRPEGIVPVHGAFEAVGLNAPKAEAQSPPAVVR